MSDAPFNLAIETSARIGSVSLGRGERLLASRAMPPQERHRVDLLPTIEALCREHGVTPAGIGEIYVSVGPGSFTGLRIGIASAKVLALASAARIVAVPTLHVLARNVPCTTGRGQRGLSLAVCLNTKKDTVYAGLYEWKDDEWSPVGEAALLTMPGLLSRLGAPGAILGHPLPPFDPATGVVVLPAELAQAQSQAVWEIGRRMARVGRFTDPHALLPLYARPPEAVELWDRRSAKCEVRSTE